LRHTLRLGLHAVAGAVVCGERANCSIGALFSTEGAWSADRYAESRAHGTEPAILKSAAVMFDYRRIALWLAVLLVPGGILLLPLLLVNLRKSKKNPQKPETQVAGDGPKTPNDGPGPNPRTPDDGTTPRLAA
jgi:hypothetical protein